MLPTCHQTTEFNQRPLQKPSHTLTKQDSSLRVKFEAQPAIPQTTGTSCHFRVRRCLKASCCVCVVSEGASSASSMSSISTHPIPPPLTINGFLAGSVDYSRSVFLLDDFKSLRFGFCGSWSPSFFIKGAPC